MTSYSSATNVIEGQTEKYCGYRSSRTRSSNPTVRERLQDDTIAYRSYGHGFYLSATDQGMSVPSLWRQWLLELQLQDISDIIVPMLSQEPTLKLRTLDELEPTYHHSSQTLEPEWCHFLWSHPDEVPSSRHDGSRVLFNEHPFALRVHLDGDEYTVAKATAVLEDPAGGDAAENASKEHK
ncbi:hypothetical protein BJX62DRAFT_232676 [Aspergillus germanicus]